MGLLDQYAKAKQYASGLLSQVPQNAANFWDELKTAPQQLGGLMSPQMGQQVNAAMTNPQQANPQQWMDQGMALAGLAPVAAPIGMFIGKGAKTWDAIAAQKAEEMLKAGHDPRKVWSETGTMRGVDGHLRQEIPDNTAKWLRNLPFERRMEPMNNVISHDDLYAAYPHTGDITTLFNQNVNAEGGAGSYHFNPTVKRGVINIESGGSNAIQNAKSTGLHELQHAIQQREGWAQGGSPDGMRQVLGNGELTGLYSPEELHNAYRNLAGEAEARLTQSRMGMDAAQRLQSYPYDMLDVPQNQLIVRGLLGN